MFGKLVQAHGESKVNIRHGNWASIRSNLLVNPTVLNNLASYRYERLPANIDKVFEKDVELMVSTTLSGLPDLPQVKSYILRQLTYRYTCQLTALYAAETAGKSLIIHKLEHQKITKLYFQIFPTKLILSLA